MQEKRNILIVDDEPEVINSIKRLFRRKYQVHGTTEPKQAIDLLNQKTFSAVISDMRMPEMNGDQLLEQAHLIAPDTPRLLLTGFSDLSSTTNAINRGKITSYISKPWNNDELVSLVGDAVEQHQLTLASNCDKKKIEGQNKKLAQRSRVLNQQHCKDKEVMQKLMSKLAKKSDSTKSLLFDVVDLLSKVSEKSVGDDEGHVKRVALHSRLLAKKLGLDSNVVSRCYLAGLMHEIGKVSLPDEIILLAESELENNQKATRLKHVEVAADLISTIPSLQQIGDIVKHQYERMDGSGYPDHLIGSNIPIESKILRVVNEYDKLLLGRINGEQCSPNLAQQIMKRDKGAFDENIMQTYFHMLFEYKFQGQSELEFCISTHQLESGMTLARDIQGIGHANLLTKHTELSQRHIDKLRQYEMDRNLVLNVFVH